ALLTALLCGLAPAFGAFRLDLNESLKEGGRGSATGLRGARFRNALVISEVALALILLTGAGLMIGSFQQLRQVQLGFDPHNLLTMTLSLPDSKYREDQQRIDFYERLL